MDDQEITLLQDRDWSYRAISMGKYVELPTLLLFSPKQKAGRTRHLNNRPPGMFLEYSPLIRTNKIMTPEQIKEAIQGGEWVSITTEVRPSANKAPTGEPRPFYCSRIFRYSAPDRFECTVMNYADANGKVPLGKIVIKGHNVWQGEHPIAKDAYKLDYVADVAYEVTPLHQGFADVANKSPAKGLNKWEVNVTQDVKGKAFPLFGLTEGQTYIDYDLIYIYDGMLFNGSKNVDGRAFDKPENRPTNLQIPLVRKK